MTLQHPQRPRYQLALGAATLLAIGALAVTPQIQAHSFGVLPITAPGNAPTIYTLQGDTTNSGTGSTTFTSSGAGTTLWSFQTATNTSAVVLEGSCQNATTPRCYGVNGRGNIGVLGTTLIQGGVGVGVVGVGGSSSQGVLGSSDSGAGVQGSITGNGPGAMTISGAVYGVNSNVNGGSSSANAGVYGYCGTCKGVDGVSGSYIGVIGDSTSNNGVYARTVNGTVALRAHNNTTSAGYYGIVSDGDVLINGNYSATGTKSARVATAQGERLMYAAESTQNIFTDQGTAHPARRPRGHHD